MKTKPQKENDKAQFNKMIEDQISSIKTVRVKPRKNK